VTSVDELTFPVTLPISFRLAQQDDLPKLEWYGQFTHHRNLFRRAFTDQQRGKRLMILADCNGFPIGHIFILFLNTPAHNKEREKRAYLYSLRVMEMFQGQGIGTRLIHQAEEHITQRACHHVSIAVAKTNERARRLYERLGYGVYGDDPGVWNYQDHLGRMRQIKEPCWLLQKEISIR
jgi:ribosomal protein S18 acetylase RimI-like enzyme